MLSHRIMRRRIVLRTCIISLQPDISDVDNCFCVVNASIWKKREEELDYKWNLRHKLNAMVGWGLKMNAPLQANILVTENCNEI